MQIDGQDHARAVYRTPPDFVLNNESDFYIKVWEESYIRRDNLLRALKAGFYDETTVPALRGSIQHAGFCRGYIMRAGKTMRFGHRKFYNLIKTKTIQTHYFHVQYSRYNTLKIDNRPSLIDLEAIYPLADLPLIVNHHSVFDSAAYARFVARQYAQNMLNEQDTTSNSQLLKLITSKQNHRFMKRWNKLLDSINMRRYL